MLQAMCCNQSIAKDLETFPWHVFRNDSDPDMQAIVKKVPLPTVNVEQIPVYVDVDMPANGCVQSVLPITYNIRNRTPYLQEMEASMESSEAFMFAGQRQVHFLF